jgi:hypothetical protein
MSRFTPSPTRRSPAPVESLPCEQTADVASPTAKSARRDGSRTIATLCRPTHASSRATWLIGPVFLASTATGITFVLRGPDRFFGLALGTLLSLALLWVLISALFPAKPDRTCPSCGRGRLRRMDVNTTRGVVCRDCDHADPDQSSFLMAEEEGALEKIVLAERESPQSPMTSLHNLRGPRP